MDSDLKMLSSPTTFYPFQVSLIPTISVVAVIGYDDHKDLDVPHWMPSGVYASKHLHPHNLAQSCTITHICICVLLASLILVLRLILSRLVQMISRNLCHSVKSRVSLGNSKLQAEALS
ncbi:hypothetical protein DEU56DRAFT_171851 [Suillus clintonianus]|uniref:uncharacterized protein n=1 Tax=Suillus clintonianus TaxID=1904413 RepID=UPI001B85EAFC|nr:uncharacterized protein DEU56DRAFT_171851 [Suillus clintonianus]KAG2146354.1 hypothetical protein DEU56DRAFT_171851 [Suillus clintonianus]